MAKIVLALVLVCILHITLSEATCDKDSCAATQCEEIKECVNGEIVQNAGLCGCCPACVQNNRLGVGVGKRCGPPTYLSCDSNLECRDGICAWPPTTETSA